MRTVNQPEIKGKEFCREARAMYLNSHAAIHNDAYIKLIKETGCNAVVIDIKDGPLSYQSPVAEELSPTAYKKAQVSLEEFQAAVKEFKEAGVYTIGRITCFNDKYYAKDHPENCIKSKSSGAGWPSAYSRDVWYYNVALATEAVKLMGFWTKAQISGTRTESQKHRRFRISVSTRQTRFMRREHISVWMFLENVPMDM